MYSKCKDIEVRRNLIILSNRKQGRVVRAGFLHSRITDFLSK